MKKRTLKKFKELAKQNKIENLLAHAPYTLNAAAAKARAKKVCKRNDDR